MITFLEFTQTHGFAKGCSVKDGQVPRAQPVDDKPGKRSPRITQSALCPAAGRDNRGYSTNFICQSDVISEGNFEPTNKQTLN